MIDNDEEHLDANLSDHEWRLKMAAEGKAFYVPGKTPEERAAQDAKAAAQDAQLSSREITLTNQQWSAVDTAIPDIIELLQDIRNLTFYLAYEDNLDALWVNAMMRLTARAVERFETNEITALDKLDVATRHANCNGA